jgi:transglutaminase-like putative cysteine protease
VQDHHQSPLLALGALTLVAALGFEHIFGTDHSYRPVVYGAAVLPVAVFWLGRRSRVPALATLGISVVALGLYVAWTVVPGATWHGVPTPGTVRAISDALSKTFDTLRTDVPPIAVSDGYLFLATCATWLTASLALWLVVGADGVLSPLVPPLGLFAYLVAIERPAPSVVVTITFVVLAGVFVALQHAALAAAQRPSMHTSSRRPVWTWVLRAVVPISVVVAVLAAAAGPLLPGAEAHAFVDFKGGHDGSGPRTRITPSPLVDLSPRLHVEPPVPLFSVQVQEGDQRPTYWRLTALDSFDGKTFGTRSGSERSGDSLSSDVGSSVPVTRLDQTFTIKDALGGFWMPAAYRPVRIDLPDTGFIAASGTLVAADDSIAGYTYTVNSDVPDPTLGMLEATVVADDADAQRSLQLPDSVSPRVRALAAQITAGKTTDWDKAKAIQDYLRDTSIFTYNLNAQPGHSEDALENFLFETHEGYCEQFASAFAVLARTVDLPARVAVGFTPGTYDPATRTYEVDTDNAHSWPEVDFAGIGWVPLEPTPGRGDPAPSNVTGTQGQEDTTPPSAADPAATTTTTAPGATAGAGAETETSLDPAQFGDQGAIDVVGGATSASKDDGLSRRQEVLAGAGALLVALLVAYPLVVVGWKRTRRRRRRHDPRGATAISGAWDEAVDRLLEAGVDVDPAATPLEAAAEVRHHTNRSVAVPLAELASCHTESAYAPSDPGAPQIEAAWGACDRVVQALERDLSWRHKLRRRLDPRPLVRRMGAEVLGDERSDDDRTPIGV